MMDFVLARQQMVDCQIRPNDVTDYDIIASFLSVPREAFVPASKRSVAYIDDDIALNTSPEAEARYLAQVTPLAKMLQAAAIQSDEIVLVVGAGSGYSMAIIANLANSVIGVERDSALVEKATETLEELSVENAVSVEGELAEGYPSEAPFDVIFVDGSAEAIPEKLFSQLNDGGRLVGVVGTGLAATISVFHKNGDDISVTKYGNMSLPTLPGFSKSEEFVF